MAPFPCKQNPENDGSSEEFQCSRSLCQRKYLKNIRSKVNLL